MMDGYRQQILNMHGLKALTKSPLIPAQALAIGIDNQMASVPLAIFCDHHLPMPTPTMDKTTNQSYEKMAVNGRGDYVTIDNFVTDDFDIGTPVVDL